MARWSTQQLSVVRREPKVRCGHHEENKKEERLLMGVPALEKNRSSRIGYQMLNPRTRIIRARLPPSLRDVEAFVILSDASGQSGVLLYDTGLD